MAGRGDLLRLLREAAVVAPILIAISMFFLWVWRRPLAPRIYVAGMFLLAVVSFLPLLPKIDSGYRQVYWLGEARHQIPWQYGPYNGSPDPGGKYFLVKVSVPDLVPVYETQNSTIIVGKAVDFNYGDGEAAPENMCMTRSHKKKCEWRRGNFVFIASGNPELFSTDISGFMVSVADLLDGFEVPER
jgi:hypothetical protein